MDDVSVQETRPRIRFAPREVDVRYRADGSILLRSPLELTGRRRHVCEYLQAWAQAAPERTFLAQRGADGAWRRISYAEAWRRAQAIGQGLLERGLGPDRPLAILTGNSLEHALVTYGAMTAGVPAAPISPAYSASEGGLKRLAEVAELLQPAMVFAQSADRLGRARALPQLSDLPWISAEPAEDTVTLDDLERVDGLARVERAFAAADEATVAKILFTSGSTGSPKGVPNTQGMLCSDLAALAMLIPVAQTPVTVDWMPWHHAFGGNSTLNGVLRDGGTFYIDDGRPTPTLFAETIRNLKEIAVTIVQTVPAGFQMLVPALEADEGLRARFFERIERLGFAGASLPPDIFHRMQALAQRATGAPIPFLSGYGATETGPGISNTHWPSEGKGELGLPFPGCELKLTPVDDRYDVRMRGPSVFSGYLRRPDLTEAAFDEEGFYELGDAVQFLDPADPSRGLRFAGRLSENFKLCNGTWVLTGELRLAVLAAAPSIGELVVAGHDRDDVRLIVWPAPALMQQPEARHGAAERIRQELVGYNRAVRGATRRIAAFCLADEPPSLADGEATDKGSVNQRAVLANRKALVEALYRGGDAVVSCEG
jgi:feruloyl-CoA synthase